MSKYDEFRNKYAQIYAENSQTLTGGPGAAPSSVQTAPTSKYDQVRHIIATNGIGAITHTETNKLKNLGSLIGDALMANAAQSQASPNIPSVVRNPAPTTLAPVGYDKIKADQAAKQKAAEVQLDEVTSPHQAAQILARNADPHVNPTLNSNTQGILDTARKNNYEYTAGMTHEGIQRIGNSIDPDAYIAELDAKRAADGAPEWLRKAYTAADKFQYKNKYGQILTGLSQGAAQMAGAADDTQPLSTNKAALTTGNLLGLAAPMGGEGNILATPSRTMTINKAIKAGVTEAAQTGEKQASSAPLFTRLFGKQGVGITAGMNSAKSGTQQQIVSSAIKRDKEGVIGAAQAGARNTYQALVDSLSPIKRTFGQGAYNVAMDSNRASNIANTIVHDKFVDMEGNVLGKSMKEIFKQVPRGLDNEAVDYLVLRDAQARVARGEKVYEDKLGMNDVGAITKRLADYDARHPELKNLGADWDAFTKNIRQVYGLESGLLNKEQIAAMEALRPNYTPMRRQFKLSEKVGRAFGGTNHGFSGQKAPINSVSQTGSVRKIVDPRKTMMEAAQKWVQNSMNNRVMQHIGDQVMADPEAFKHIAEIVRTPTKGAPKLAKAFADADELAAAVKNGDEEGFLDDLSKQFRKLFDKAKSGDDTVLTYMKNGQPVAIRIKDPEAVRALASLGPQNTGVIVKALGAMSNLTKRSATGVLAPFFAAKQLTVDLPQALIQSPNALAHLGDYGHALVSSIVEAIPDLKNTALANLAKDFERSGGAYSSILRTEKGIKRSLNGLKRNALLSPEGVRQGVVTSVKAPFKALEKFGDVAENLNRIAAFKGSLRSAGNVRSPENVRNAINAAREITTNFSRKGTMAKELESALPYNNAAIQGVYRFLKTYKDHPVKASAATLGLAVLPKMVEYARFGNDPDYQQIPARERYRRMYLNKNADGTFAHVQMPQEYNAIGSLTVDLMRRYLKDDPNAMKGVADALMNAYTPPVVSGLAQGITQGGGAEQSLWGTINAMSPGPLAAAAANQSFTGSPIVSKSLQGGSPKYQYDEKTTAVAKKIGSLINWSPKKVDYLLRQYTGDVGRYILPLTSTSGSADTMRTLARNFITDPVYTNTLTDDYYRVKDLISNVESDNKNANVALPSWYSERVHKLATSTARGTNGAKLKDLNDQKKQINADKSISNSEKARKLRELQVEINSTYTDVLSQLEDAGVPIKGR